jgi:mannose-6-phosphate isomerase
MNTICILENRIQEYAWGSHRAIGELLGIAVPTDRPQAELWMGDHPKGPSRVRCNHQWMSLPALIDAYPQQVLGPTVSARFGSRLPFLFKVLAAARPLSIQAHPDRRQARAGFARENQAAIPLDAPQRNYRDASHKPECLCALTPFWALCGFRRPEEIATLAAPLHCDALAPQILALGRRPAAEALRDLFGILLSWVAHGDRSRIGSAIGQVRARLPQLAASDQAYRWIQRLCEAYGEDIGVLAPLFLNLLCLQPGEALFLPAGTPHAYLGGTGIELMANSDNVLRGGLTAKHVDPEELLRVLRFEPTPVTILAAAETRRAERTYPTAAEEFVLSVIKLDPATGYRSPDLRSAEILLCTAGEAMIAEIAKARKLRIEKGTSVMIPAAVEGYTLEGSATLYKAAVPLSPVKGLA